MCVLCMFRYYCIVFGTGVASSASATKFCCTAVSCGHGHARRLDSRSGNAAILYFRDTFVWCIVLDTQCTVVKSDQTLVHHPWFCLDAASDDATSI